MAVHMEEAELSEETSGSLRSRATRGAAWSGVSTIMLRLSGLVVSIILARILTPDQFGVYAVALTVQGILMTVADLGLSADLIRSEHPERLAPTIASLGLVSGGLLTIATFTLSGPLAELMGEPEAAGAISMLSFTLLLAGVAIVPYGMMVRRFQQREIFFIAVADFIVSTVLTLVLVMHGWGALGLATGRVSAQVVTCVLQFFAARVVPRYGLDRSELRGILSFALPIAMANLLAWVLLNVDNIILARMAGATALGFYVLAFNISNWPMSALSQVVRSIALPYVSRVRDSTGALYNLTSVVWAAALPAGALLAALASPLITVVYGEKWATSIPVLAALGVYGSIRVAIDLFTGYLYALGSSRSVLWLQLASLVTLVIGMLIATPRYGIIGAAWVHVLVGLFIILPGFLFVVRDTGVSLKTLAAACLRPTIATIPAIGAVLLVSALVDSAVLELLLGAAAAAVAYLAVAGPWLLAKLRSIRSTSDSDKTETSQETR